MKPIHPRTLQKDKGTSLSTLTDRLQEEICLLQSCLHSGQD